MPHYDGSSIWLVLLLILIVFLVFLPWGRFYQA